MNHVHRMRVSWPLGRHKPEYMKHVMAAYPLFVPNRNYVLLRRFSAKEEERRLVAAPYLARTGRANMLGLENHLNYIYRPGGTLTEDETFGLAALFSSALLDGYFRTSNGNTQVSATELRTMPLPALEIITALGRQARAVADNGDAIDQLVMGFAGKLGSGAKKSRVARVEEARKILKALGLPAAQFNEMSALTLIALCGLGPDDAWAKAARIRCTVTKGIMDHVREKFGKDYAANTRETFRRQVLHQFVQAHIVDYNAFEPDLPTNSPRAHYAVTKPVLAAVKAYGTAGWKEAARRFVVEHGALTVLYSPERERRRVPVTLPDGQEIRLSPGKHNEVQKAIVEEFAPRFAPGSELLYLGDTAKKDLVVNTTALGRLGIPITEHDKLPDVVLYDRTRQWVFLIEAVTSHGPVSPKRIVELDAMFANCPAGLIYVSAFPDMAEFKRHAPAIAWETEVWLGDVPDHLIHFNGDRFFGPRTRR